MSDTQHEVLDVIQGLRKQGINPYPEKFDKKHTLAEAKQLSLGTPVSTAGRVLAIRTMGKLTFVHLFDFSGKMQIVLEHGEVGKEQYSFFQKYISRGDFVGVKGEIFVTKKGEISVLVKEFQLLGKALAGLPDKWLGLEDQELKYRHRYLDMIANPETMPLFTFRSDVIRSLREFYWGKGFYEVETPVLMHKATGAVATPYKTHHNALGIDVFLRISHELPLKELIVGGFEKIFEIGKAFRNEGIDPSHLPEHTHIEHYCAYWNFEDNMTFTEEMFGYLFERLGLPQEIRMEDGNVVDYKKPWPRLNFIELVKEKTGIDILSYEKPDELLVDLKKKNISFEDMEDMSLSGLIDNMYKKLIRPQLKNPTFLYFYPVQAQPLARKDDKDERLVDQFQLVINGWEIVKAYSELVDPVDQEERFQEQIQAQAQGATEVMEIDRDYIKAMSYGMPPISGWGMGADRLVALLLGKSQLRDVVLFPLLRPKE